MRAPSEYGSTMPMPLRITSIARPYGAQPSSTGARIAVGVEQLVVWPTVLVLVATLVASLGPRRR
jgi:hypothetical protein